MAALEAEGMLDREAEALPTPRSSASGGAAGARPGAAGARGPAGVRQAPADRRAAGSPTLLDDPWLGERPARLLPGARSSSGSAHLLGEHPLRRELVATLVANDVVDSLGPTFVVAAVGRAHGGAGATSCARYRIARDAFGAVERWAAVEALDGVARRPRRYWTLMRGVDELVEDGAAGGWPQPRGAEPPRRGRTRTATAPRSSRRRSCASCARRRWREERRGRGAPSSLSERGVPDGAGAAATPTQPALVHAPDIVAAAAARPAASVLDVARAAFVAAATRWGWSGCEREVDALPAPRRAAALGGPTRCATTCSRPRRALARRRPRGVTRRGAADAAVAAFLERARGDGPAPGVVHPRAGDLDEGPTDLAGLTLVRVRLHHRDALRSDARSVQCGPRPPRAAVTPRPAT